MPITMNPRSKLSRSGLDCEGVIRHSHIWFIMSVAAATLDTIRKFIFSFVFRVATRLRFDLKEKLWLSEMENGARGHLNTFAH